MVYHEPLKASVTINTDRCRQQMMNLNHAFIEKRPEMARRHGKVIWLYDNAPIQSKTGLAYNQNTWLGAATLPVVFTRLSSLRLPFVFIDGTRIG